MKILVNVLGFSLYKHLSAEQKLAGLNGRTNGESIEVE